jgi:hypothetical protein
MKWLVLTLALLACVARAEPISPPDVDLELVLCVDTSDSIDSSEFALQRQGIALAFQSEEIINAVERGALGRIAVSLVDFSDDASVRIPFVIISDRKSAHRFAAMVLASNREKQGNTSISAGIWTSVRDIDAAPYLATRRVIDVSGDGANNRDWPEYGISMDTAVALAKKNHIVINGLPIESDEPDVAQFYQKWVLTGHGAFMVVAKDVADFGRAIRHKLILEVS